MLQKVLGLLERENVFGLLGADRTYCLVRDIVVLSEDYDCNPCEILEEHAARIGICYSCLAACKQIKAMCCPKCYEELEVDKEDTQE